MVCSEGLRAIARASPARPRQDGAADPRQSSRARAQPRSPRRRGRAPVTAAPPRTSLNRRRKEAGSESLRASSLMKPVEVGRRPIHDGRTPAAGRRNSAPEGPRSRPTSLAAEERVRAVGARPGRHLRRRAGAVALADGVYQIEIGQGLRRYLGGWIVWAPGRNLGYLVQAPIVSI